MAAITTHDQLKLAIVKTVHTIIYVIMASATIYVLFCGITGRRGASLLLALGLVSLEGIVFLANGMRCPLTALARKYGDPKGYVGDIFFPETCTRYTFRVFGGLFAVGLILIVIDYIRAE